MFKIPFFNFRKKDPPEFYKEYESLFTKHGKRNLSETRFVVFDTETTGLDKRKDRMLSIGAVALTENRIDVADSFERYLDQEFFREETVHIHGLLKKGKYERISEEEAVKQFLAYIGNSVLVGHHVGFDIAIINYALKRLGAPKLKNKAADTGLLYKRTMHRVNILNQEKVYTLDELCDELKLPKTDRHTASGDAFITAMAFLKILGRMKKKKELILEDVMYKS